MGTIKLPRVPDRTPSKMAISVSPNLGRALTDYADFYEQSYGRREPLSELIPAMLTAFLGSDREFERHRRKKVSQQDLREIA